MPTFVFKRQLHPHLLRNFLEPICIKNNTHYVINYETLKRARFTSHYDEFIEMLRPYYYPSKIHYIDAPVAYKRFLTIIRQICTYNNFAYTSTTVYDRAKASLEYRVYYTGLSNGDPDPHAEIAPSKEETTLLPK
jgi:hypothetical protein